MRGAVLWPALILGAVLAAVPARAFVPPVADSGPLPIAQRELLETARLRGAASGPKTLRADLPGVRALVLLVEFADTTFRTTAHPPSHFESLLFAVRSPSVRAYYEEISCGGFILEGEVHPLTRLGAPIARYTGDGQCEGCYWGIGDYPYNSQGLVEDLVARVDPSVDFSRFDSDVDGVVDILFVVHAGVANEDRPGPRRFHSHQWHTVREPVADGVRVVSYVLMSEWSGLGGFAHEMAHLFGLPDLYDLGGGSEGLGDWSLMGSGARLGDPVYANPAHPDAWTRLSLGFAAADTAPIAGAVGSVRMTPVATGGRILKLWNHKRPGSEYFLVESRSRSAARFDRDLPGEGLLVYHVDDAVPTNNNPFRYHVALEQADGRFDLEHRENRGDAEDPFPIAGVSDRFDAGSSPDSRAYDGSPSGVGLVGVAAGDGEITFDLSLADGPGPAVARLVPRELRGDGDLRLEAGETWWLDLAVENRGRDAPAMRLEAASSEAAVEILPEARRLGPMLEGETLEIPEAFEITVAETLATNPFEIPLLFSFWGLGVDATSEVRLVGGDRFGLAEGFESGAYGWTHETVAFGAVDPWHRSDGRAFGGRYAMKCGDDAGGDYPDSIDAALVSPPVLLGAGSLLRFQHWMNAEAAPPADAYDGGRIELSRDRRRWVVLEPLEGYTHVPIANATFDLWDHPLFGGYTGGWREVLFDLSAYDGESAWIRFRFASDKDPFGDGRLFEGWYLDDLRIETHDDPVGFHLAAPVFAEGVVSLRASVVENFVPFDGTVRLDRTPVSGSGRPLSSTPTRIAEWSVSGGTRLEAVDAEPDRSAYNRYRLLTVEAGIEAVRAARTLFVPGASGISRLVSAAPVPFDPARGSFRVVIDAGGVSAFSCEFFDVAGRRVAHRVGRRAGDGLAIIDWDGRSDNGGALGAGVYFYRLDLGGAPHKGRTLLLR